MLWESVTVNVVVAPCLVYCHLVGECGPKRMTACALTSRLEVRPSADCLEVLNRVYVRQLPCRFANLELLIRSTLTLSDDGTVLQVFVVRREQQVSQTYSEHSRPTEANLLALDDLKSFIILQDRILVYVIDRLEDTRP